MQRDIKISPKVYGSNKRQKIYVKVSGEPYCTAIPAEIRIQPLEQYSVRHSVDYCIKEPERYEYMQMTMIEDCLYECEYDFSAEQKYGVTFRVGDVFRYETYIYAVDEDLAALKPLRGDTHVHTSGSDGREDPFTVACNYRRAGFDFIAVTDHHKMPPSVELKKEIDSLTSAFTVFRGEEVHNKDMGYFHIVNFGGEISVNDIIETDDDYVNAEVERIIKSRSFDKGADPYYCAYRIFIAEHIRKGGGLAILPHPYWPCFGEYNCQTADTRYLLRSGCFDAFEVIGGCDRVGNGDNLQVALWQELCAEHGYIPVVGASDSHTSVEGDGLFNKHFSIVFAKDASEIKAAIKEGRAVAVNRRSDNEFFIFGKFRLVKYARFLLDEYFPLYAKYTADHAELLASSRENDVAVALRAEEAKITKYQTEFFRF